MGGNKEQRKPVVLDPFLCESLGLAKVSEIRDLRSTGFKDDKILYLINMRKRIQRDGNPEETFESKRPLLFTRWLKERGRISEEREDMDKTLVPVKEVGTLACVVGFGTETDAKINQQVEAIRAKDEEPSAEEKREAFEEYYAKHKGKSQLKQEQLAANENSSSSEEYDWNSKNRFNKARRYGLTKGQIENFILARKKRKQRILNDQTQETKRLEFLRWLYEHGRINDGNDDIIVFSTHRPNSGMSQFDLRKEDPLYHQTLQEAGFLKNGNEVPNDSDPGEHVIFDCANTDATNQITDAFS